MKDKDEWKYSLEEVKTDESSIRWQYCITCDADVVILCHVLPYLIDIADSNAFSNDESSDST